VNGEARPLGYFSQVRVEPGFRGGREILQGGFGRLHALHRERDTPIYATTIIADNHRARRALAGGWPGLPTYREREVLRTLAIPVFRRPDLTTSRSTLRRARAEDLPEIVACLQRHHRQFQLAPVIDAEVLVSPTRSRGLRVEDFAVALRGGRLVGCVALWNQLGFKQLVVEGYRGPLRVTRTLVNGLAPLLGIPRLPNPGSPFQFAYLAHLAADPADDELWAALVRAGCARAFESGLGYVSVGLTERHPQAERLARTFRHVAYRSIVYVAHWEDGAAEADRLDDRPGHLEIAML
jgi:hypothetical protein